MVRDFQLDRNRRILARSAGDRARRGKARRYRNGSFFFPAAAHTEKDGSFTNTQRLLQWHHKAVEPPGDAAANCDFIFKLGQRLKKLYANEYDEPRNWPIRDLTWDYPMHGPLEEPERGSRAA